MNPMITQQNLTPAFPDIVAEGLGPSGGAGNGMTIANLEGGGWYVPAASSGVISTLETWVADNPGLVLSIGVGLALMVFMKKGKK